MMEPQKFKCQTCFLIITQNVLDNDGNCPICLHKPDKMCPNDHLCRCREPVNAGVFFCNICGKSTCPCGCEDVQVVSRVTGYLSTVSSWNQAKQAEWRARKRTSNEELLQ